MAIETIDTSTLAAKTGNLYEALVVTSKRARQIASATKEELDQKLAYFDELSLEATDELLSNEDQLRISLEYERKPKPSQEGLQEMLDDEVYFRNPAASAE